MIRLSSPRSVRWLLVAAAFFSLSHSVHAAPPPPRRVLILHSFGRDYAPHNILSSAFKTDLTSQPTGPVEFYETSIDATRPDDPRSHSALLDFLAAYYGDRGPDLIVSIAGPAARFCLQYRHRLFPDAPLLMGGLDGRHLKSAALQPRDACVTTNIEPAKVVQTILQILPDTTTIAVVLGSSPNERFWAEELRGDFRVFGDRVGFTWLTDMSLQEVKREIADLPPHSAVFYVSFVRDSTGIAYEYDGALAELKSSSAAPFFGVFEDQIGRGVLGGPVLPVRDMAQQVARAANRILQGEDPAGIRIAAAGLGLAVFDWRELQRQGIDEGRLPPGSILRFKEPSLWGEYRTMILLAAGFLVVETGLIILLLLSHARRRHAQAEARALAGRILTAHEDERRRLAGELHDDVTQRLACLAIDAGMLGTPAAAAGGEHVKAIQQGLVRLSEDVHALSYRLHPSILDDLGLPAALQAECDRFSLRESIPARFHCRDVPSEIPREVAICLYRVAQGAVRNVGRHAKAGAVSVSLRGLDGGLQLAVTDDGVGFDATRVPDRPSIGHASMRERVNLIGGELEIESAPGQGTTVMAWVPFNGESR